MSVRAWKNDAMNTLIMESMTDLGYQSVCDQHGVINFVGEMREALNMTNANNMLQRVANNLKKMARHPGPFVPSDYDWKTFDAIIDHDTGKTTRSTSRKVHNKW